MDDLKFESCRDFSQASVEVRSQEFADIATAFKDNIKRINAIATLPAEVNYWSSLFSINVYIACDKLNVREHTPEVNALANTLLADFLGIRTQQAGSDPAVLSQIQWNAGVVGINSLMGSDSSGEFRQGLESTLAAMITAAWAALETLSIDLWVAALNKHPGTLGIKTAGTIGERSVTIKELAGRKFDLRSSMGDFLAMTKKVSLEPFDNVKKAYGAAFDTDWKDIFGKHPDIRTVEKVRNLFAHRSGRVDRRFIDVNSDNTALSHARLSERLFVDGVFTARCVDACVKCGVDLVTFVDEWSQSNAEA